MSAATGESEVRLEWGLKIALRDGVHLNGVVYRPVDERPAPALLIMSPYGVDTYHVRARDTARAGLAAVVVDVRGRGGSEGWFRPLRQEADDGHDVVEWIAEQPWCTGAVAMRGVSYCGFAQWATASQRPPHLMTIIPTAAPFPGLDFPMRCNIFHPYVAKWLLLTAGKAAQFQTAGDLGFWAAQYHRWHISGAPFRTIDAALGVPNALFQEWLDHPAPDAYWDAYAPTDAAYAAIDLPVLTITGAYDDDQPGALEHYRRHLAHAGRGAARHVLLIGPWDHGGTGVPGRAVGGLALGAAAAIDMERLHREWIDWVLGTGPRPLLLAAPVNYYMTGDEHWRQAASLAEVTAATRVLSLGSRGDAGDELARGRLVGGSGDGPPDSYIYDPIDMFGPEVAAERLIDSDSLVDDSLVRALAGKQLIYDSAPLDAPLAIAGFVALDAWISIDCPDTDLYATLFEVEEDGRHIRLTADAIRARYREDPRRGVPVTTTAAALYRFERFPFVARRLSQGSRLRLTIAPMGRLLQTNFAERNFNAGGAVAAEGIDQARTVTVTLFHDAAHPSVLRLPLGADDPREPPRTNLP